MVTARDSGALYSLEEVCEETGAEPALVRALADDAFAVRLAAAEIVLRRSLR